MSNEKDKNLRKAQEHLVATGESLLAWLTEDVDKEAQRELYQSGADLAQFISEVTQKLQDTFLDLLEELDEEEQSLSDTSSLGSIFGRSSTQSNEAFRQLMENAIMSEDTADEPSQEHDTYRPQTDVYSDMLHQLNQDRINASQGIFRESEGEAKAQEAAKSIARAGLKKPTIEEVNPDEYVVTVTNGSAQASLYVAANVSSEDLDSAIEGTIDFMRPHNHLSADEREAILSKLQTFLMKIRKEKPNLYRSNEPRFTFPPESTYAKVSWFDSNGAHIVREIYLQDGQQEIDSLVIKYLEF